jgi:hypothetical protein
MAQRLIELVDSGRIADEAALKRAFRRLAKRIHPDVAAASDQAGSNAAATGARPRQDDEEEAADAASKAFITLKAEYEEALARLASKGASAARREGAAGAAEAPRPQPGPAPRPLSYSARAFYEGLEDLLGRGFPTEPARAAVRASYLASRDEVLGLLAGRDLFLPPGNSVEAFLAFEEGLSAIMAAAKPNHPMEGRFAYYLRNLVANALYYHKSGSPQPLGYARNEWPRLGKDLRGRGETRPLAFLALVMADLEAGPACLDDEAGRGP